MKPRLFIMLGYPGSGKSYFARQLAKRLGAVRLNGDGARHMMFRTDDVRHDPKNNPIVFGALDYATRQVLDAGVSVIYDASHNRRADRAKAAELAKAFDTKPILVWMQAPVNIAKQRQQERETLPDQPIVPTRAFHRLVAGLQPPEAHELCITIDGTLPFAEQFASFQSQLKQIETTNG